jgi:hypothetical protein
VGICASRILRSCHATGDQRRSAWRVETQRLKAHSLTRDPRFEGEDPVMAIYSLVLVEITNSQTRARNSFCAMEIRWVENAFTFIIGEE